MQAIRFYPQGCRVPSDAPCSLGILLVDLELHTRGPYVSPVETPYYAFHDWIDLHLTISDIIDVPSHRGNARWELHNDDSQPHVELESSAIEMAGRCVSFYLSGKWTAMRLGQLTPVEYDDRTYVERSTRYVPSMMNITFEGNIESTYRKGRYE